MSFIGAVGVVAQQGNQGAAGPTDVSVATAETGGTDNAFTSVEQTGLFHGPGYSAVFNHTCSGSIIDINLDYVENGYETDGLNHPGYITGFIYGYIRATGATTYAWSCAVNTEETTLSNSITGSITGSSSDAQDGTGRDGTGFMWRITLPAQGTTPFETYAMPDDGDVFTFMLTGVASDNSGNDVDEIVPCTFRFIAP